MESYPNPYSAVIATFNQQSSAKDCVENSSVEDEDDPRNIPDDDLLLWANAQFTFDGQSSEKDLEDEIALRIARNKQQQYLAAQQQARQQHQQHQQQQQQKNQTPMQPLQQLHQQQQHQNQQYRQQQGHQPSHAPLYHPADVQQQLQQFDAIHGYLDANNEDPRTSLSLVERSRQRNPVSSSALLQQQQQLQQQNIQFDPRIHHSAFAQQLGQPLLGQQQQQFQPYPVGTSPLPSPDPVHDYHQLQFHPRQHQQHHHHQQQQLQQQLLQQQVDINSSNSGNRSNSVGAALSSLSLSSAGSPSASVSHEEKLQQLENELKEYQSELAEERKQLEQQDDPSSPNAMDTDDPGAEGGADGGNSESRSRSNSVLSHDDPDYAAKLAAAEEDKRRRNTAASARFRQKKRLREQILEKTAKEMTAKSELLEIRVKELEMEIKWLRGLIVEKDASRVLLQDAAASSLGGKVGARPASSVFAPSSSSSTFPNSFALAVSPPILLNNQSRSNPPNSNIDTDGNASKQSSRRSKKP
ncbi:hypothetical protein BGZ80_003920 [Entomortierella chlamydospora]|uniref:BZIP domain-containing protein n=1 Tax=Entomortierella chlamydospora TaxID=101097 RepID=A0A9P6T2V9_9FUNG|nr:hypothetical protein BGZ80_003920 [Entomortierella chlamydospora]